MRTENRAIPSPASATAPADGEDAGVTRVSLESGDRCEHMNWKYAICVLISRRFYASLCRLK